MLVCQTNSSHLTDVNYKKPHLTHLALGQLLFSEKKNHPIIIIMSTSACSESSCNYPFKTSKPFWIPNYVNKRGILVVVMVCGCLVFCCCCCLFVLFFLALWRAIPIPKWRFQRRFQMESSNEIVRYWNLHLETDYKYMFNSVNCNIQTITFKSGYAHQRLGDRQITLLPESLDVNPHLMHQWGSH